MKSLSWQAFRTQLSFRAAQQGIPVSGVFELTARCNLNCRMCYVCRPAGDFGAKTQELTAEQWLSLFRQARDAGMLYILLTGGEVFLRLDFREIYEGAVSLGLIPTIYTNAALITPEIIRWLRRRPPEKVEVTLYGASPEIYNDVCGVASAYEKVVRNIDALLEAGIDLQLKTTVIPTNRGDYEKLMEFSKERNIPLKFCFYISPVRVDAGYMQVQRLSPMELADYIFKASNDYCEIYNSMEAKTEREKANSGRRSQVISDDYPFKCSVGKTDVWITWNGKMTACGLMDAPFSRPLNNGFQQALLELRRELKEIPKCEQCTSCSLKQYCLTCPARLQNETGSFKKPAEYLCELARYREIALRADEKSAT